MRNKILRFVLVVFLIGGLTACGTPVGYKITATPAGVARQPKKIFVVLSTPENWDDFLNSFEQEFSQSMQDCGGRVTFLSIPAKEPDLSLTDDAVINKKHIEDGVKAYKPDAVLAIVEKSVEIRGNFGQVDYDVQMVDPSTHQKLMYGTATVATAHGDVFADEIIKAMKGTQLMSSCPLGPVKKEE